MREKTDTQESLPEVLSGALEHIEERGSLLWFAPDRTRRLRLMKTMTEQGLVVWNRTVRKYELTTFGRQCLDDCRQIAMGRLKATRQGAP